MARPRGKLFALLAIFAAIGLVTASGAFTSVSADRTATVTVDGDQNAILGLTPFNGTNGDGGGTFTSSDGYAQISNGVLEINLGRYENGVAQNQGLNYNATTDFDYVFNVSNNGASNVNFYIVANGGEQPSAVTFYNGTTGTNSVTGSGAAQALSSGETASISIRVDLSGTSDDSGSLSQGDALMDSITINATAT